MDKNQIKSQLKESEGKIKEVTGKIVGNKNLQQKGEVEKNIGKLQKKFGNIKDDIKKDH